MNEALAAERRRLQEAPPAPAAATADEEPAATGRGEASDGDKPVDYGAILHAGMQGAPACLEPRPTNSAAPRQNLSVSVVASGSGLVTRAEVRGSGLTKGEVACMERIARTVRFPSPVAEVPLRVSTTVTLEFQPPTASAE